MDTGRLIFFYREMVTYGYHKFMNVNGREGGRAGGQE